MERGRRAVRARASQQATSTWSTPTSSTAATPVAAKGGRPARTAMTRAVAPAGAVRGCRAGGGSLGVRGSAARGWRVGDCWKSVTISDDRRPRA